MRKYTNSYPCLDPQRVSANADPEADHPDGKKEQAVTSSTSSCGPLAALSSPLHHHHQPAGHCLPVVHCTQPELPPQLPMPWAGPCLRTHQLQHGLPRDSHGHVIMMTPVCETDENDKLGMRNAIEKAFTAMYRKKLDQDEELGGEKEDTEGSKKRKLEDH